MRELGLIAMLPQYWLSRTGMTSKVPLPISWTLSLTYRCQARCATCNIREHEPVEEMTVDEWSRLFMDIGEAPYFVTFSGGEPFLYKNIYLVFSYLVAICNPAAVNIPTNGQLTGHIVELADQMTKRSLSTKLTINVSIDHHVLEINDKIRGLPGYYDRAIETVRKLIALNAPNLTVGIHTVVSKWNVQDMPEIRRNLSALLSSPDNYVTEIAENRVELGTMGKDITPSASEYRPVADDLKSQGKGLKQAFRKEYYENVSQWLYRDGYRMPTCYAGYANVQVAPNGDIWPCCLTGEVLGNLQDVDFNFDRIWQGEKARKFRDEMKRTSCSCPMANVSYVNALMSPRMLAKVVRNLITR